MSKTLFVLAALVAAVPAHAVTVVQWNFNSVTPDSNTGSGTILPAIGGGTASLVGGTTASFASGDASGGSSDPASGDDSGWNTTAYPAAGTADKSAGVLFMVSTLGYTDVVISWDQRHSNTSSRYVQLQYTTDGSSFVDAAGGLFEATAGDTWFNARTVNLTGVAGVADNASFGFRVVSSFAPGGGSYLASSPTGTYGTSGTMRFDMVTLSASPVPETSTALLMLAGMAGMGFIARRRA